MPLHKHSFDYARDNIDTSTDKFHRNCRLHARGTREIKERLERTVIRTQANKKEQGTQKINGRKGMNNFFL
jgi:hypothetical protein